MSLEPSPAVSRCPNGCGHWIRYRTDIRACPNCGFALAIRPENVSIVDAYGGIWPVDPDDIEYKGMNGDVHVWLIAVVPPNPRRILIGTLPAKTQINIAYHE